MCDPNHRTPFDLSNHRWTLDRDACSAKIDALEGGAADDDQPNPFAIGK